MSNRLKQELSPYLLQHKENPVDWHPWGEEAFQKAKKEDKPILVSIGYATCHWCHVMARESFQDSHIASIMNELFVNIKVDREELPAVDHYYMEAIQLLTGSGGWPLNCFLTPDKKPFVGGTYFPPEDRGRHVSWRKVLLHVAKVFQDQRGQVDEQAERVHSKIESRQTDEIQSLIDWNFGAHDFDINSAIENNKGNWDLEYGGMKGAPKFPMPHSYSFLLLHSVHVGDKGSQDFVKTTARSFVHGGLFDPVHGGFARYCVDAYWRVPHFEKMLYDNAGILTLLALTNRKRENPYLKWAIEKTLDFLQTIMCDEDGLFFSAVDADSEGQEGKFYTWNYEALKRELTEEQLKSFRSYFDIHRDGNWEETNILYSDLSTADTFLKKHDLSSLDEGLNVLKRKSANRIPPSIDTKKLVDWNALMIDALFTVAKTSNARSAAQMGKRALDNLLSEVMSSENELLYHARKGEKGYGEVTLDDYAFLIQACISAYQFTFDLAYLKVSGDLASHAIKLFSNSDFALFQMAGRSSKQVSHTLVKYFDSPYPSGNSVMSKNLYKLGKYLGKSDWIIRADKMVHQVKEKMRKHPMGFGTWLQSLLEMQERNHEIVILGPNSEEWARRIYRTVHPETLIMASEKKEGSIPLLNREVDDNKTHIFFCQNFSCKMPVISLEDFWDIYPKKYLF